MLEIAGCPQILLILETPRVLIKDTGNAKGNLRHWKYRRIFDTVTERFPTAGSGIPFRCTLRAWRASMAQPDWSECRGAYIPKKAQQN